jgi:hypothetical protein
VISLQIGRTRLIVIGIAVLVSLAVIAGYLSAGDDEKKAAPTSTTTTTTLPPKDAQACEYLTLEALLVGGIVPDVEPRRSDDLKRCEYRDIGGEVNYITLYVDDRDTCAIWLSDAQNKEGIPEISSLAVFVEDIDPTVIVPQGDRCFFLQGSKTLITKVNLIKIAKEISLLLKAVDTSTTTTVPLTVVLPETSIVLPGQNTAPTTTTTAAP